VGDTFGLTFSMALICGVSFLVAALSLLVLRHRRPPKD
jgi:hypothetical protein